MKTFSKISLSIIFLAILSVFLIPSAKAETSCTDASDSALIDVITNNSSTKITKKDDFKVLIQNTNNFDIKFAIDIYGPTTTKTVIDYISGTHNGQVDYYTKTYSANNFIAGSYNIKIRTFHKEDNCLLTLKDFPISITEFSDLTDIKSLDGKIDISVVTPEIKAGEKAGVKIVNNSSAKLQFDIRVNDLETGEFLKKSAGTINFKDQKSSSGQTNIAQALASITTPGNHKLQVNILNTSGEQLLYQKTFDVKVLTAEGKEADIAKVPAEKEEAESDPEKYVCPVQNYKGDGLNGGIGGILGAVFGKKDSTDKDCGCFLYNSADASLESILVLINEIIAYALDAASVVAFIMILWAARFFLNSGGAEEKAELGKKTLTWALVGILVIALARTLLVFFYNVLKG